MLRTCVITITLLVCTVPAGAGPDLPSTAMSAYRTGAYEQAARLSEQAGTATSMAFAAQALIADAISRPEGFCVPCLERAERLAERAMELDPHVIDGYLQDAVAIGFRGRSIGVSKARAEGLAEKARSALDRAMSIDPNNVWARASLGAWHLEIVTRAGRIFASVAYGASRDEGLELYRAALKDAPGIAVLHYHYALSILALDADGFRTEAERELRHTLTVRADDALTAYARMQAQSVLDTMQSGTPAALDALVRKLQGYPATDN